MVEYQPKEVELLKITPLFVRFSTLWASYPWLA